MDKRLFQGLHIMAKILVVDDEPGIIQLIATLLENEGHSVVGAASAPEALAVLNQEHIDLILLDLMLPHMSGWEFLDLLPQKSSTPPPVTIVSAVFNEAAFKRALEQYHTRGYVTKPFRIDDFLAAVNNALVS